jgi:hypothetical protein
MTLGHFYYLQPTEAIVSLAAIKISLKEGHSCTTYEYNQGNKEYKVVIRALSLVAWGS